MPDPSTIYQSLSPDERRTLERLVIAVDRAYSHTGRLMWRSFLQGLMSALGATVGTFLLLGILGYFFQKLGGPGLIQQMISDLSQSIVQAQVHTLLGR